MKRPEFRESFGQNFARSHLSLVLPLARLVRACARSVAVLVCVDGLAAYREAFRRAFRRPVYTGKPGRPRLEREEGWMLGQVIKQYARRRVVAVTTRIVEGSAAAVAAVLAATGTGTAIHTASIERLNATFRSALAPLVRRGRALVRGEAVLEAAMYLVGCRYNFCWYHRSLRVAAGEGAGRKWRERTPAMAAGLTPVRWTMLDLLSYHVPLPVAEPRRRRLPRQERPRPMAVAA